MLSAIVLVLAEVALFILLLIIVLLCLPLHLNLQFNSQAKPSVEFKVALLGGALSVPMKSNGKTDKSPKPKKKPSISKKRRAKLDIRPLLRHLPQLMSRLFNLIKFEMLRATIGFGFDSPADTGMVYGMLTPFERVFGNKTNRQIVLHPDFDRAKFESTGHIAARFTPITIVPPLLGFGWAGVVKPRLAKVFK